MDLVLLLGVAISLVIVAITIFFLKKKNGNGSAPEAPAARGVPMAAREGVPRRAQIVRNQRNRARPAAAAAVVNQQQDDESDDSAPSIPSPDIAGEKMGTKKRAKLEAKAEKKAQRDAELNAREDRKKKEALADEERKKQEQLEELEEKRREEAERLEREEIERKEHEEYLKMKQAFAVEEEGFDEEDDSEKENLLQEFINYIKENKVVVLEDLAAHFKLKTQAAIDRIQELQKCNKLTGVIDDQGKFIFISDVELESIHKFVTQRGRVSIAELAENSNKLISMTSST